MSFPWHRFVTGANPRTVYKRVPREQTLKVPLLSSRFFRRIFLPYLLLICAATVSVGIFAAVRLHDSYLRGVRQSLQHEAILVSDLLRGDLRNGGGTAVEEKV